MRRASAAMKGVGFDGLSGFIEGRNHEPTYATFQAILHEGRLLSRNPYMTMLWKWHAYCTIELSIPKASYDETLDERESSPRKRALLSSSRVHSSQDSPSKPATLRRLCDVMFAGKDLASLAKNELADLEIAYTAYAFHYKLITKDRHFHSVKELLRELFSLKVVYPEEAVDEVRTHIDQGRQNLLKLGRAEADLPRGWDPQYDLDPRGSPSSSSRDGTSC